MLIKILKEPLLHFLLMGVGIFAWFAAVDSSPPEVEKDVIEVSMADLDILTGQFEKTWQRQPTKQELQGLAARLVRQEVLVREAIALGMDQNDAVIRRRLQQKMEFFVASVAESLEPTPAELEAFYQANDMKYRVLSKIAFLQVFLGPTPSDEEVDQLLGELRTGAAPENLGVRSQLTPRVSLMSQKSVDAMFGSGFAEAVDTTPMGEWSGPVRSGYGYHLVFLDAKEPSFMPPLQDVQNDVTADWRSAKKAELMDLQYDKLIARFTVLLPAGLGGDIP